MRLAVPEALRQMIPARVLDSYQPVWYGDFEDALRVAPAVETMWLRPADITLAQGTELIARASKLKWLHLSRVGLDILPLDEMAKRNIVLSNGRGLTSDAIAEHVIMCMFALRRGLPALLSAQMQTNWTPGDGRGDLLKGSVALVLGHGNVGRAVAERARALGVKVTSVRRQATDGGDDVLAGESWKDHLATVDVLVLALPLTAATRNLVGRDELSRLKPSAIVINVARGEILDEAFLAESIREGRLGGAALDCFQEEPLPASSPLWKLPNTIITPHIAWLDSNFVGAEIQLFDENAGCYSHGRPLRNVVDPGAGY